MNIATPIVAPERAELAEFFSRAARWAAERGWTLHVGDDRPTFCAIQRGWGHEPWPGYEPGVYSGAVTVIVEKGGQFIATYAAVPVLLSIGTLTERLAERGLYDTPVDRWRLHGAARELGDRIRDRAAFSGGISTASGIRGSDDSRALTSFLPVLGRALCVSTWNVPACFFFVREPMVEKFGKRFGAEELVPEVTWMREGNPLPERRWFGYAGRQFILDRARL
jgi:hypothetical protein